MNTENEFMQLETEIVKALKDIYDPEIPVNIYDLGLIYEIKVDDDNNVSMLMTLTSPNCPIADQLLEEVEHKVKAINGIKSLNLKLTFDPPWDQSMLSEEAKLEMGFL
jgi:FeS assembly SUF system protein